ncbi:MAG: DUF4396 domain-containing protein [Actinobacteria bacterium]|nr:DUF4396 domain-containing protein [Actinomycetota bacterium]
MNIPHTGIFFPDTNLLFWGSLAAALLIAGAVAHPVNRWLIARVKGGHAVAHAQHGRH